MRNLKRLFICGAALAAATLWGDSMRDYVNGHYWSYYIEDGSAVICDRYEDWPNGVDCVYSYSTAIQPSPVGTVTIPLTLGGYPVSGIGNEAFSGCYEITNVVIRDGIKSIGDFAFKGCLGLESAVIGKDVERIGRYAFNGIRNSGEVPVSLASIVICATNLQELGVNAFPSFAHQYDELGNAIGEDCVYTFVAPETPFAVLPEIRCGHATFAGWWTALDGGEELGNAADAVPGQTYYAHWSDETITIASVELAITNEVTVYDEDWYKVYCDYGDLRTDFIAAVYDGNGNIVDDWESDCDIGICYASDPDTPFSWYVYDDYPNEWGNYYGHEVRELPAGNYIVKVTGNGTWCTGEATAPLTVNMFYDSYSWELDSDDWSLDIGGSSFYPTYNNEWVWDPTCNGRYSTTDCGVIGVYSTNANASTAIARLADSSLSDMSFYAEISGERRLPDGCWENVNGVNYSWGDGYYDEHGNYQNYSFWDEYGEYHPALAHMAVINAGAYDLTVSVSGYREYNESGYSHIEGNAYGEGYFHFELAPASFTNQTIATENGQSVFTGEAIRPLAQGFSITLDDPTTYFIENIAVTNVGTYAVRVGLSTGLSTDGYSWSLSAPDAEGEWVKRAYSDGSAYNAWGGYDDAVENLIFNYTGVVEVAYTVLPRQVGREQASVVPCELHCDGTPKICEIVITNDYNGAILVEGIDYDIAYSNNVLPGFASAVVTCKGNYAGSFSREFEILPSTNIVEVLGLDNVWVTGGDAEWFTEWTEDAHDGTNHLHSGAIGDGQESWVETVVTNSGVVSFWWRASSESYRGVAYDKLIFTIDGAVPESVPPIGGETDWSNVVCAVEGNGPHVLRWTYQKDESDFGGEDCAWLDDVQYLHQVRVVFAGDGATGGAAPEAMTVGEGFEITIPGQGALAWPRHRFLGWRADGEVLSAGTTYALGYDDVLFTAVWEEKHVVAPTITVAAWYDTERTTVSMACGTPGATIHYTLDGSTPTAASPVYRGSFQLAGSATIQAVAMLDDWFDSEVVSAVSVRAPWTSDECLNVTGLVFTTGGAAAWARDRTVAHDGDTAMRSGEIGDNQVSWIETEVTGAGTLTFWWRASSEAYKGTLYDRARFMVDGLSAVTDIGGITDWRFETVAITGGGTHRLRWEYYKDPQDAAGDDCVWLDEVTWTPEASPGAIDVGGVAVSANWLDNYPTLLAEHGGYEEAAKAVAANGHPVADCYVAGVCPTNATDVFRAVISMEKGAPIVSWEPDLNEGGTKHERVYTVEGKEKLTDDWAPTNSASRFFRVKVEMP